MSTESTAHAAIGAFNRHDLEGYLALYAEGITFTDPQYPEPQQGPEAVRMDTENFFRAFPDVSFQPRGTLVGGDIVAFEGVMAGTNTGPMEGPDGEVPPTGKRFQAAVALFLRIEGDRIVEEHRYYDQMGMLAQLGLLEG